MPETKSAGKQYLNWATFVSLTFERNLKLKTIQYTFAQYFFNLVLVCKKISPSYDNDRIKVFFSTVVILGRFMTNLLVAVLKQLSINDKGCPVFKNICFKKLSSS